MVNMEIYSWDTLFGLINPSLRYPCGQVVFCVNLGTSFKRSLQLGWGLTGVHLSSNGMFLGGCLHRRSLELFIICSYLFFLLYQVPAIAFNFVLILYFRCSLELYH
jgi:hypothetical protein